LRKGGETYPPGGKEKTLVGEVNQKTVRKGGYKEGRRISRPCRGGGGPENFLIAAKGLKPEKEGRGIQTVKGGQ